MMVIVINTILPPNLMGILGKILMGGESHTSKARSSLVEGTRVGDPIRSQVETHTTTHQWM